MTIFYLNKLNYFYLITLSNFSLIIYGLLLLRVTLTSHVTMDIEGAQWGHGLSSRFVPNRVYGGHKVKDTAPCLSTNERTTQVQFF